MFREDFHGREGLFRLRVLEGRGFVLSFERAGRVLVAYRPGERTAGGRTAAYAFRSVEQLRYDFERDVEDALRQG